MTSGVSHRRRASSPGLVFETEHDPWVLAKRVGIGIDSTKDFKAGFETDDQLVAALFTAADDECYAFDIVVAPEHQGGGLGSKLMDLAIADYEELREPFPDMRFCLDAVNPQAVSMLQSRGFEVERTLGDHTYLTRRGQRTVPRDEVLAALEVAEQTGKQHARWEKQMEQWRGSLPDEDFVLVDVPVAALDISGYSEERAQSYAEREGSLPPILAYYNERSGRIGKETLYVPNGNHRARAAEIRGEPTIAAYVPASHWDRWRTRGRTAGLIDRLQHKYKGFEREISLMNAAFADASVARRYLPWMATQVARRGAAREAVEDAVLQFARSAPEQDVNSFESLEALQTWLSSRHSATIEVTASDDPPVKQMMWRGMPVSIEVEGGNVRYPNQEFETWIPESWVGYGYFDDILAEDGDSLDVIWGPEDEEGPVFVAAQSTPEGEFTQFKVMVHFADAASAEAGFKMLWPESMFIGIEEVPADIFVSAVLPKLEVVDDDDTGIEVTASDLTQEELVEWTQEVKRRLGLEQFNAYFRPESRTLVLADLMVPKDRRKQGVGTRAMEELSAFADRHGLRIYLTPGLRDTLHGTTSRSRLVEFYKNFDFVENKGRHKDFTLSPGMYRDPKTAADVSGRTWYHGDTSKRLTFADQQMQSAQGNAMGPGIYFTSDEDQARGYAGPSGWVYAAKVSGNFVEDDTRPTLADLRRFFELVGPEGREMIWGNWDLDPRRAQAKVEKVYLDLDFVSAFADLGRQAGLDYWDEGREWTEMMVALGYDGLLHTLPAVEHLVVWNPAAVTVIDEAPVESREARVAAISGAGMSYAAAYDAFVSLLMSLPPHDPNDMRAWSTLRGPFIDLWNAGRAWRDALLRERAIPPKEHKAVEMAARMFSRQSWPKDSRDFFEKNKKRFELLREAVDWPEKAPDAVLQVGGFEVHDTIGLDETALADAQAVVAKAASAALQSQVPGMAATVHGPIFLVGQLQHRNHAAWYKASTDEVFLRPRVHGLSVEESARHLVHELAHRLWTTLPKDVQARWATHHRQVGRSGELRMPESGQRIPHLVVNQQPVALQIIRGGEAWLVNPDTGASIGRVGLDKFYKWLRESQTMSAYPTAYAATDPEEHFCEAVALEALGRLDEPHTSALRGLFMSKDATTFDGFDLFDVEVGDEDEARLPEFARGDRFQVDGKGPVWEVTLAQGSGGEVRRTTQKKVFGYLRSGEDVWIYPVDGTGARTGPDLVAGKIVLAKEALQAI